MGFQWGPLLIVITLVVVTVGFISRGSSRPEAPVISYSQLKQQIRSGNVARVVMEGGRISGSFRSSVGTSASGQAARDFDLALPPIGDDTLLPLLEEHRVEVNTRSAEQSLLLPLLLNALPILLLIGITVVMFRRNAGGAQSLLKMTRTKATPQANKVTTRFGDVAGMDGPKRELQEVVAYLKNPERFQKLGGKNPKGVLLVGQPGTGKTLLARAGAGEAGVAFMNVTGSDFMEMFVGVGASRVRDLFDRAKRAAPAIIFVDEIDSIGRRRGAGVGGGHDEREQTLNQLLGEMDGFEQTENVVVIAATNRPDILDPALMRPGRFDRHVTIDLPVAKERLAILTLYAQKKPLDPDIDLAAIARSTTGFSGADLENLLNESALLAARKELTSISALEVDEARDKIVLGLQRDGVELDEKEARAVAIHEAGHAIVAAVLPNADPLYKVSVIPRGRAMGVTHQVPLRERYLVTEEYLRDRLAVILGGRAAELLFLESRTTGAEGDLQQASTLARRMVMDWGMSDVGPVHLDGPKEHVFLGGEMTQRRDHSEATARAVDEAVRKLLDEAYQQARGLLQEHSDAVHRLTALLGEHEEVEGKTVMGLIDPPPPAATSQTP